MWVSLNDSFLLIIYCVKYQNKLCCTIIPYCELKPKWITIMFLLNTKSPIKQFKTDVHLKLSFFMV